MVELDLTFVTYFIYIMKKQNVKIPRFACECTLKSGIEMIVVC